MPAFVFLRKKKRKKAKQIPTTLLFLSKLNLNNDMAALWLWVNSLVFLTYWANRSHCVIIVFGLKKIFILGSPLPVAAGL